MENLMNNDRSFYTTLLRIAIPVMLQQLIMIAVGLSDTFMVGVISEEALAAVGAANQIFLIYINTIFGFLSGVAVFSVQYWGINDLKMLRKLMGIGYALSFALGVPVMIGVYIYAPSLISLFSDDPTVIEIGATYSRIVVFTYLLDALTFVISYNSRVTQMLKWPTIFNATAVGLNIFLNWCFIFGNMGMPEMGAKGAAIATLISRIVEFILTFTYIYMSKEHPLRALPNELVFDFQLFKRVMRTAMPVVMNELLWALSVTFIFAIYGRLGPAALAVVQISMTISGAFQAIYFGLGNGCNVVVGQELGRGDKENAYRLAKKCLNITWVVNVLTTVTLIASRGWIVGFYSYGDETNRMIMDTLLVFALAQAPKMLAYEFVCGIFRPGGDTMWSAVVDGGINWIIQVPFAILAVSVFKWELAYCVAFVTIGDVAKTVMCYYRFFTKKWMNIFTSYEEEGKNESIS